MNEHNLDFVNHYKELKLKFRNLKVAPKVEVQPVHIPVQEVDDYYDRLVRFETTTTKNRARSILKYVCSKHGVSEEQILGDRRFPHLVTARHDLYYRLRKETRWSLASIAAFVGRKDHTSIMHGIQKHEEILKKLAELEQKEEQK